MNTSSKVRHMNKPFLGANLQSSDRQLAIKEEEAIWGLACSNRQQLGEESPSTSSTFSKNIERNS